MKLSNDSFAASLTDRYSILEQLGQGGSSITYAAIDHKTDQQVAIKALSLTGLDDWKKVELFQREAKILQQLDHRCIPKYLDYFQTETETDVYFYIVQQLAPGQSLADLIVKGWQPDEATVKQIAQQILEILIYLQQLTPPVIHRDLKPQNVIYQPDTGKLFLVDFGAVQDTYHHTVMGSTVVGTYGYMAPEQYRGGAVLSTDLYSLGCTLLFLLTRKSPAELPQKKLKLDFRNWVEIEPHFADWIERLIEPNVKRRLVNAETALLGLQSKISVHEYDYDLEEKPRYSSVKITEEPEQLIIDIPPSYLRKRISILGYGCLLWSSLSILNRIAIFTSIMFIGKIYILLWLFNIFFTRRKLVVLTSEYLCLFWFCTASKILPIPRFSIYIIVIDLILQLCLKHDLIKQLLFPIRMIFCRVDRVNLSPSERINYYGDWTHSLFKENLDLKILATPFKITRKIFNLKSMETAKYITNQDLPNVFLTEREKSWLGARIRRYIQ